MKTANADMKVAKSKMKASERNALIAIVGSLIANWFVWYYLGIGDVFFHGKSIMFKLGIFILSFVVGIGILTGQLNRADAMRGLANKNK